MSNDGKIHKFFVVQDGEGTAGVLVSYKKGEGNNPPFVEVFTEVYSGMELSLTIKDADIENEGKTVWQLYEEFDKEKAQGLFDSLKEQFREAHELLISTLS